MLPPRGGYWAMPGDICGCHDWGREGALGRGWVRPGLLFRIPRCPGRPTSENGLAPSVHGAEAETPLLNAYSSTKY